jgi:hypothetical protein
MNVDRSNIYQTWEYAYATAAGHGASPEQAVLSPAQELGPADPKDSEVSPGVFRVSPPQPTLAELNDPQLLVGEVDGHRFTFPFVSEVRDGRMQASSIYGYAGVAFDGDRVIGVDEVRDQIKKALAEAGFAKAFIRWGVEHRTSKFFSGDVEFSAPVRMIPLLDGVDNVFMGGECSTHRSQVARGKKSGIMAVIQSAPDYVDLIKFRDMYVRTMDRVGADEKYFFSEEYFARLAGLGHRLVQVQTEKSKALFLAGSGPGPMAYYHLSAREKNAHNTEIHMIFDKAVEWALDQGMTDICLGGGHVQAGADPEQDSLYLFKSRIGRGIAKAEFTELVCDPNLVGAKP